MEEERRKIIIPIGDNPGPPSKSAQSFFDTQSTKNAKPVVPLSGPPVPGTRSPIRKVLVVLLVIAICAGIVAGGYMYLLRGRGRTEPQAAVQPIAGKTLATLPWTHTPEEPVAAQNADASVNNTATETAKTTEARADSAADARDQKKTTRQARTKPARKKNDNQADDPVKNTQDELHRIRDIFEGPP